MSSPTLLAARLADIAPDDQGSDLTSYAAGLVVLAVVVLVVVLLVRRRRSP